MMVILACKYLHGARAIISPSSVFETPEKKNSRSLHDQGVHKLPNLTSADLLLSVVEKYAPDSYLFH